MNASEPTLADQTAGCPPADAAPALTGSVSIRTVVFVLTLVAAAYSVPVAAHWNVGHLDFGDGNYMYISWRVAHGTMPYRDVLSPQPPVHLTVGALLAWLGSLLPHPLYAFRLFSLLLHVATMVVVYAATARACRGTCEGPGRVDCRLAGILAALIYMLLPLGFWWSLGYQSEPTEMLLFMVSFWLLIAWTPRSACAAGITGAFPALTNMTAAPYTIFNIAYLAVRRRSLLASYGLPVLAIIAVVTVGLELLTGSYLDNVILNQVGSFPRKEFLPAGENVLTYALGKLHREGLDVLRLEGGFVLLALAGLIVYALRGPAQTREYVSWYGFFAMCSIVYVSKGGTEDYIFTIGEPFVALFGGFFLAFVWRGVQCLARRTSAAWDTSVVVGAVGGAIFAALLVTPGLVHSWATLKQRTYELDAYTTRQVADEISRNTGVDDIILAPPHYAFLAQRRIAEDYSELFLWYLKYLNERQDRQHGRGVQVVERIAELLRERRIAFVLLDLNQTGKIPEIRAAIEENYMPLRSTELQTLNTRLQFYKPKSLSRLPRM